MAAIPLISFPADSVDQQAADAVVSRADPRVLVEEEGWNLRDYLDPAVSNHIESLAASYLAGLWVPPLIVQREADGTMKVLDGCCRRRAALLAISRGADIPHVEVVHFSGSDTERTELMLRAQEGLKFTPLKLAEGYLRLERMGRSVAEISSGVGRSRTHVESYLILARANTDVHGLVRSGEVNAQAAIDAFRVHGEQAGAFLAGKLAEAKARGKKVLSQDAVKEWAPPRKHAGALYGSMSAVVQSLDQATRRQLAEIENLPADARAGHKITVDAATFLEMFHAHVAATDFRDAKQKKGDEFQAAAAQQQLDIAQAGMGVAPQAVIQRAPAKPSNTVVDLKATYKGMPGDDPLLGEARQLVIEDQRASISYMQRKLRISYNRAAGILEELERQKVLSPCDESGTRSVLLKG